MGDLVTVVVGIGNSDNKLTQAEWSNFIGDTHRAVHHVGALVYFSGHSAPDVPWQNACWVLGIERLISDDPLEWLKDGLSILVDRYGQDSIALTVGTTEFVNGRKPNA